MISITMKQAETIKNLLLKNKKSTTWLDKKMVKAKTTKTTKKGSK